MGGRELARTASLSLHSLQRKHTRPQSPSESEKMHREEGRRRWRRRIQECTKADVRTATERGTPTSDYFPVVFAPETISTSGVTDACLRLDPHPYLPPPHPTPNPNPSSP